MNCQGLFASVEMFADRNISTQHKHTLYSLIILYLFRGTDQASMIKFVQRHGIPFRLKDWAATIPKNGVLLKFCKVYCYARVCGKNKTANKVPLSEDDRIACDIAIQASAVSTLLSSLYKDEEFPVVSHENLDKVTHAVLTSKELLAYRDYYAYTKMRFLATSYGQSMSDMKGDLLAAALLAIYKAYPRYKNLGVLLAISKSAMKNRGTNIIKTHTTKSRNALVGDRGKEVLNVLSLDFIYGADGDGGYTLADTLEPSRPDTNFADSTEWQLSGSIAAIRSSKNLSSQEKDFCLVIMGVPNASFTAYIGEDNEQASNSMGAAKYMKKAATFFMVNDPESVLNKALEEI